MKSGCTVSWASVSLVLVMGCSSEGDASRRAGEQSDTRVVSAQEGATLSVGSAVTLQIPAGSVTSSKTITVATVDTTTIAAAVPEEAGKPVALTPHGTTFATPVTVKLAAPAGTDEVLRLDNEQDKTWEVVQGATFANGVATFTTDHFSIYVASKSKDRHSGTGGAGSTTTKPLGSGGSSVTTTTSLLGQGGMTPTTTGIGGKSSGVGGSSTASGGSSTASGGSSTASGGSSTAIGGTSSGGGTTGTTATVRFCTDAAVGPTRCERVGIEMCAQSLNACCGSSPCAAALNCTLAGVHGETSCISDAGDANRTLYNAVKQCLIQYEAGCGFTTPQ